MKNKKFGFFPMFVDLSEKQVVVVGAGQIAARRIEVLQEFVSKITVVAERVSETVEQLANTGIVQLHRRAYVREDLYGADLVLAATDDQKVNDEIHSVCKCLGIMVNVSTDQTKCDFHFPGIIKKEELVIGLNAGGMNHALVKKTRKQIEQMLEGEQK